MPSYPTSDPTDSTLYAAVNNFSTVLSAGIDNSVTTIPVISTTGAPTDGFITIGTELIHYTSKDATNFLGATRGYGTTTAATHSLSDPVTHAIPAEHHNASKDEIKAIAEDLRDSFEVDLDDSVAPAATATNHKERQDQIATQLKNITGETDWKTVPTDTLDSLDTRLDTAESDIGVAELDIAALEKNVFNILVNGGMEVWKRGTSFAAPTSLDFTLDKWMYESNGTANCTVERNASPDVGNYAAALIINTVGTSTTAGLRQDIENIENYEGKIVTLSMRVKTPIASAVRISITDDGGTTSSSYHTGGGAYETLTVTRTLGTSLTGILIRVRFDANITTSYLIADSAMLVIGSVVFPFVPEDPGIEEVRCERYYQRIGGDITNNIVADGFAFTTTQLYLNCQFITTMKSVPVITIVGGNSWQTFNSAYGSIDTTSVAADAPHKKGCGLFITAPGASFTMGQGNHVRTQGASEYLEAEV